MAYRELYGRYRNVPGLLLHLKKEDLLTVSLCCSHLLEFQKDTGRNDYFLYPVSRYSAVKMCLYNTGWTSHVLNMIHPFLEYFRNNLIAFCPRATGVCVYIQLLSHVQLFANPWTITHQALLSMGFPRQEYWSVLTFPSPGDLPNPGIKPASRISCTGMWIFCCAPPGNSL